MNNDEIRTVIATILKDHCTTCKNWRDCIGENSKNCKCTYNLAVKALVDLIDYESEANNEQD